MSKKHTTLSPTLLKVLEVVKLNKPVTPSAINDYIGKGNYAAKHVLYLRILGYDFDVKRDGRNVVSYTLTKIPDNVSDLIVVRNKVTPIKTKKPATKTQTKKKNLQALKAVAAKRKSVPVKIRKFDDVEDTFGSSGEVQSAYSVDKDWDSVDGLDLKKII